MQQEKVLTDQSMKWWTLSQEKGSGHKGENKRKGKLLRMEKQSDRT